MPHPDTVSQKPKPSPEAMEGYTFIKAFFAMCAFQVVWAAIVGVLWMGIRRTVTEQIWLDAQHLGVWDVMLACLMVWAIKALIFHV